RNDEKAFVTSSAGKGNFGTQGVVVGATAPDVLGQLLPPGLQDAPGHAGVAQYDLPGSPGCGGAPFTLLATRAGDDVVVEIRRRRIPDDDHIPEEFFAPPDGEAEREPYPVFATGGSSEMPRGVVPKPAVFAPTAVARPRRRRGHDGWAPTVAE